MGSSVDSEDYTKIQIQLAVEMNYNPQDIVPKLITRRNLVKMHHCASLDSSPTWLMTSTESRPVVLSVIDHRNNLEDNDTGYLMANSTF